MAQGLVSLSGMSVLAAEIIALLLLLLIPFGVSFALAGIAQYFERKVSAVVGRRYGPTTASFDILVKICIDMPLFFLSEPVRRRLQRFVSALPVVKQVLYYSKRWGLGQMIADGIKMFTKEDTVPASSDALLFKGSTYIVLLACFVALASMPISQNFYMTDFSVAATYTTAVTGLSVVGLLVAGWGSNNKFSLLGGIRAVAQIVSYEIPVGLAIAAVAMWSGTLSLQGMIAAQYHPGVFSFLGWNLFQSPFFLILSVVYYTAAMAECNRTPFDLAESESELVAGYGTEFSGLRWGLFFIGEYTDMILVGGIFSALFLGGYQSPVGEQWIVALPAFWEAVVHGCIFLAKFVLSIAVMMWLRWTLPRFRIDQVMRLAWVRLIPLSLGCLFLLALSMLWFGGNGVETIRHGRFLSSPVVRAAWWQIVAVWAVVVAVAAVLVALAKKYGEPRPMPRAVHDQLVGGQR
jgi:NADH-quinone oxidoreductase subunit H